ncbi:MAG: helix-turn-helix domain-containing protein [Prevotella sp.]|jgi:AraC-like DNA-binding protein
MKEENPIINIDSVDTYNRLMGFETRHPLVAVVDLSKANQDVARAEKTFNYGVYALWLKQVKCGDLTYGRMPYDFQDGTVTSFAPGQVVHFKPAPDYKPNALGLLFHPDLIRGTSLGKEIQHYDFFSYSSREALHLSEDERGTFRQCLAQIEKELEHAIDRHSRKLICRNIELLLDHCMRFYDRQFVTRKVANRDVLARFEMLLNNYFDGRRPFTDGLPSVRYFAEECFLSPNYFGDLVKKETGRSPMEYIQAKIVDLAKEQLAGTERPISDIAYSLGFQYCQHFNRYFKRSVGKTPSQFRKEMQAI